MTIHEWAATYPGAEPNGVRVLEVCEGSPSEVWIDAAGWFAPQRVRLDGVSP